MQWQVDIVMFCVKGQAAGAWLRPGSANLWNKWGQFSYARWCGCMHACVYSVARASCWNILHRTGLLVDKCVERGVVEEYVTIVIGHSQLCQGVCVCER
jgi:hypothetical protein